MVSTSTTGDLFHLHPSKARTKMWCSCSFCTLRITEGKQCSSRTMYFDDCALKNVEKQLITEGKQCWSSRTMYFDDCALKNVEKQLISVSTTLITSQLCVHYWFGCLFSQRLLQQASHYNVVLIIYSVTSTGMKKESKRYNLKKAITPHARTSAFSLQYIESSKFWGIKSPILFDFVIFLSLPWFFIYFVIRLLWKKSWLWQPYNYAVAIIKGHHRILSLSWTVTNTSFKKMGVSYDKC